ncbi:MAG: hypothetical protein ACRDPS_10850 [Nocardioides sp.]|uniref:hypothetical protein n=1 Tax=Nocardioides sp. TaxID=35761 RepID=UPI003D6AB7E5
MRSFQLAVSSSRLALEQAADGLRTWTARQVLTSAAVALGFGLLLGVATVLIPNPIFSREIPPVWWNYPVWVATSVFSGMLVATYLVGPDVTGTGPDTVDDRMERRSGRFGIAGSVLAWFAVGCPVCNKLALLALGYSGAINWFAPAQPFLAFGALILTGTALVWRLRGQTVCPVPSRAKELAQ